MKLPSPKKKKAEAAKEAEQVEATAKGKRNRTLLIGGGLAVVALAVLGGGYFSGLFDSEPNKPHPNPTPHPDQRGTPTGTKGKGPPKVAPKGKPTGTGTVTPTSPQIVKKDNKIEAVVEAKSGPSTYELTNLLPEESQFVASFQGRRVQTSPFGSVFFEPSSSSAAFFAKWMGFSAREVEQFICGGGLDEPWIFTAFRVGKEVRIADLQGAMDLETPPKTFHKRDMYLVKNNELFALLGDYFGGELRAMGINYPASPQGRTLSLNLLDSHTIIVADTPLLEQFLKDNAKRKELTKYSPQGGAEVPPVGKTPPKKGEKTDAGQDSNKIFSGNPTFLTIDPSLKEMMNQLEDLSKPGSTKPVATIVLRTTKLHQLDKSPLDPANKPNVTAGIKLLAQFVLQAPTCGITLSNCDSESLKATAAFEYVDTAKAKVGGELLQFVATKASLYLSDLLSPIVVTPQITSGTSGPTPPISVAPPSPPLPPGTPPVPESTLAVQTINRTVFVKLDVNWKAAYYTQIFPRLGNWLDLNRGKAIMFTGRPQWQAVASVVPVLEKASPVLPQGAFPRPTSPERLNLPYPPEQRVSFMVELLPHLGYASLASDKPNGPGMIKRNAAWDDPDNLTAGSAWVPEFLNPNFPRDSWRARLPSKPNVELGGTNFVGLGGIGLDAANYPDDASHAAQLGLFGYNRQTKLADITDGTGNTIFMVQIAPTIPRPWIRGGGATIAGVPEKDSIKPFVTAMGEGKSGTYAIMADGSIRFLSATTDDKIFKALATYKGGEKIDDINKVAPVEKAGPQAELKTPSK